MQEGLKQAQVSSGVNLCFIVTKFVSYVIQMQEGLKQAQFYALYVPRNSLQSKVKTKVRHLDNHMILAYRDILLPYLWETREFCRQVLNAGSLQTGNVTG